MRVEVIVNPKAGAGKAVRRAAELAVTLRELRIHHEVSETQAPGHATELARRAFSKRADTIVVVGGDGTLSEVAQAYLPRDDAARGDTPPLAVVSAGTGGDFARTLGTGSGVDFEDLLHRVPQSLDLGVATFRGFSGEQVERAFINVLSFGISGKIDLLVSRGPKWMGGKAAFYLASLWATAIYKNPEVEISLDGKLAYTGKIYTVALANGRFFGGGMLIAPAADPSDGRLEVIRLGDLTRLEAVALSRRIYRGTHLEKPKVERASARSIEALPLDSRIPVLVDVDGETPGTLPLHVRVVRHAIRIRV